MGPDTIRQITHGILLHGPYRRKAMIGAILSACVMVFAGSVFIGGFLEERPWVFAGYWLLCAWLTLLAVLLALFDMLVTRKIASHRKRKLRHETFGADSDDPLSKR